VPEYLHRDPRRDALLQQQRRRGVPRIVQAGVPHGRSSEQPLPRSPVLTWVDRAPVRLGEDQAVIGPFRPGAHPLLQLLGAVSPKCIDELIR
jgi:hypothetical protein